ncbi:DMT family transporter [Novosphingobium sp. fls2-241-R2A-195]|jgi:inner membrane transporter RhtA|uniref:EamA family transporter n=1 Tax=Novosphingobium sp. fls2-241-R2A-195 TaxID=3040296 RepID=UPI002551AFF0|nr:DMT family transporter [Novosphingobium sp. fls2-241-R2A-195]
MSTLSAPAASSPSPLLRAAPYAALICSMTAFCVGTSYGKQLFPIVGATGAIAYRVGFSALLLLLIFRPWRAPLTRADLFATMRYGAVLGLMNLSFYLAIRTIPLGLAIAIEFLGPLTVSLLYSRRPGQFAMVAMAAAGLVLLLPLHASPHALDPVGVGFALMAGLCWGLYIVFGKKTTHLPGGQAVALGMATGALVVVPIGIVEAGTTLLNPSLMLVGLAMAVLSSALPYSLEMIALKQIPANRFGVLMSLEPAAGALAGVVLLGEHLVPVQWLAVALVVAASVGSVLLGDAQADLPPAQ